MSSRFTVQVDADQFDRLARPTQPLPGVAELVWNALDAEAEAVTISIGRTDLDAVDHVVVIDDGHGMTHDEAIRDFKKLGGSWKKIGTGGRRLSKTGQRSLHGSQGEGRFRAFALGREAEWISIAEAPNGELQRTVITGSMDSSEFVVSDPESLAAARPGTTVKLTEPRDHVSQLLSPQAPTWLVSRFAVYLVKYPQVAVVYDGTRLDTGSILERSTEIPLDPSLGGDHGQPILHILEWKREATAVQPTLLLCDENGVALHEIDPGDDRSVVRFTAYVAWDGFSAHANDLLLADLGHPDIGPVVDAARQALHGYIDSRDDEQKVEIIKQWKAQKVYPYTSPPSTPIEQHERRIFDAVAITAASAVSTEPKAAKFSLRLLQSALAESPDALFRVLQEVLELTPEQLADFDQLLERTTLASLIQTSKLITDRLDFLSDLEGILFDPESKKRLLERSQLQRVLAGGRTWVFGEGFGLAVDDKGLTKVLAAHIGLLKRDASIVEPVTDTDGRTRIVDLMLSKASFASDRRQHLVVELKRPALTLTQTELNQITNYAVAIAKDERFQASTVTWDFWLVGDAMDPILQELTSKPEAPGLYQEGQNYRIWVRRWAEVIEENRQRLHFYRDHLDYQPAQDADLEATLSKYLPPDDSHIGTSDEQAS